MLPLAGGIYLGWTLGANNAANVFGTAVAARIISFRKAIVLCSIAVVAGAVLQGEAGIRTLSGLSEQTTATLLVVSIAAALTATAMTVLGLPISTSQAVVGAIIGIGLATNAMQWDSLVKVVVCWIATPIGSMLISVVAYKALALLIRWLPLSILTRDKFLWSGLIVVGTYGSYSLGANNVANATGIFAGHIEGLANSHLALVGGLAIALGVLTYSRRVMVAVGSGVLPLDAFCAFVAVFSMAITVHVFAVIGVPVSTSQAIVGSIIGIGLMRGVHAINFPILRNMFAAWLFTPAVSLILAAAGYAIFCGPAAG